MSNYRRDDSPKVSQLPVIFFSRVSSQSTGLAELAADGSRLQYKAGTGDFHWKQRTSWLWFANFYKSQSSCAPFAGLRDP